MTLLFLILTAILIYYFLVYRTDETNLLNSSARLKCPSCSNAVEKDYNVCPICKETLKRKCANCGEMLEGHWNYCPYCEAPVQKKDRNL